MIYLSTEAHQEITIIQNREVGLNGISGKVKNFNIPLWNKRGNLVRSAKVFISNVLTATLLLSYSSKKNIQILTRFKRLWKWVLKVVSKTNLNFLIMKNEVLDLLNINKSLINWND